MSEFFMINPGRLTLDAIQIALAEKSPCRLMPESLTAIEASYKTVKKVLDNNKTVYGINTGFGSLASQTISRDKLQQLQHNLVLSHACGTGDLLDDDIVALILLLKINNLAQGYSGVRPKLIDALITLYNHQIYPCIPGKGSVGASGDL